MATVSIRQNDVLWIARVYGVARLSRMLAMFVVAMALPASTVLELRTVTVLRINAENAASQVMNAP